MTSLNWVNRLLDGKSSILFAGVGDSIFTKSVTSAANAGQVDLAEVSVNTVIINRIILRSEGITTGDFTSASITSGTSLDPLIIVHIPTVLGTFANLDAEAKQVSWEGG